MGHSIRLENDLIKKSRPKYGSSRYKRLADICFEKGLWPCVFCERCQTMLINPQSILIHQGRLCQQVILNQK